MVTKETKEKLKKCREERDEKLRKEDLERISKRLSNMKIIIQSLITEFGMIEAISNRIAREEREKNPYDWRKDKSLLVNK